MASVGAGTPNGSPFGKDGIDEAVVRGDRSAVNPDRRGTKAAAHYDLEIQPLFFPVFGAGQKLGEHYPCEGRWKTFSIFFFLLSD